MACQHVQPLAAHAPRRVPISLWGKLKETLAKLCADKIISPLTDPTDRCTPIVVTSKKDGNVQLC